MKKTTPKKINGSKIKTVSSLINFKVTARERAAIVANANRFAQGNLSAWVRKVACRKWKPKSSTV